MPPATRAISLDIIERGRNRASDIFGAKNVFQVLQNLFCCSKLKRCLHDPFSPAFKACIRVVGVGSDSSRTKKQTNRAAADFKLLEAELGEVLKSSGRMMKLALCRCEERLREIGGTAMGKYFEALRTETGKLPEDKSKYDLKYQQQAQKAVDKLMNAQLKERTCYDAKGWVGAIGAVFTTVPAKMASDTNELERILSGFEKLMQPVSNATWDEVKDAWMVMCPLLGGLPDLVRLLIRTCTYKL